MDRNRLAVLLVGDGDHHEFREAVGWLCDHTILARARTVDQALELAKESGRCWRTVIVAQARPAAFSSSNIERLGRAFPLAHYVALLGSFCEGDPGNRGPCPGMVRVYWHQFLARCQSELGRSSRVSSWELPRTASEPERTETTLAALPPPASGVVAIFTPSALLFDGLSAACQKVGYATLWCPGDRRHGFGGATAAIWDGTFQGRVDFEQLNRISNRLVDVPVIALLSFPRHDQVRRARTSGADAVVSSPFMLVDIWNAIRATAEPSVGGARGNRGG